MTFIGFDDEAAQVLPLLLLFTKLRSGAKREGADEDDDDDDDDDDDEEEEDEEGHAFDVVVEPIPPHISCRYPIFHQMRV